MKSSLFGSIYFATLPANDALSVP